MSTTDPTGEGGGGGGGGEGATTTNAEQNASPSAPITGAAVPVQAAAQQQQQQQQQHPPPSPLSGCYLLVVLPEPHTAQHKDLILNRLAKGFLSWDKDSCHVDLEKELLALVAQAPEGEEARNGERLIQYATENLVTEVLIHPQTNTLLQCIRNLLASFTKHRHIIHAGYTFGGNGSWILQDGTFSLADFLDAFSEHEVQRVLRAYENSVTVDIHCAGVGDWTTSRLSKEACCRSCRVRVNPDDVLTAGVPAITSFTNYIGQYLVSQTLDQLMEPSDVVGNIRFSHPTLYVFPGGQGDAALFGINGFNMLVDGGFARKACFWDFTRHLDRLDAVLITRINNSNIGGMFSVLRKKKDMHVYPQIGHFFCNLVERRQSNSPDGDKDIDPLILNLTDIGQEMVLNLRHINLRAHPCYRDPDPINLYHKVGHGTLDMYVLSPSKDSREVREFLAKWHTSDSKLFAGSHKKDTNNLTFPIQNLVSICALLVWQPANPEDNITRILFPGSTPQHKIFEGFERLKHLDFLKHPVCSAKTLSPSTSLATLRDKPAKQKFSLIEKEPRKISELKKEKREPSEPKSIKAGDETVSKTPQSTPIIPTSKPKAEIKTKKVAENKKIETDAKESKKIEKELKEVKKEPKKEAVKTEKPEKDDIKKTDLIKPESEKTALKEPKEPKEPKPKPEPKKKEAKESKTAVKPEVKKSETVSRPKRVKPPGTEKKDSVKSSPTTPKKTLNGAATKTEISKVVSKAKPAAKAAPSLPAKSAKEANNRKVVEQKKSEVEKSAVKDTAAPAVKAKPKPIDRKPISRRAKPISPSKARLPGSPAKSTRSTPTTSVKSDKDGVIRKVKGDKGTTDSSTVSTPSGIEPEVVKPIDKSLIEQSEDISLDSIESKVLADLKEEREVVEEIEAVLQKAERIEEIRKDDRFEADDEITAEATDKKEEDITEEDVTAEIEDAPKKESSRKESQELTEEDEYLIVEKEEIYTEDSAQSGEGEQKHVLDEAESEKAKILKDVEEKGEKEEPEEKGKDETPEKKVEKVAHKDEEPAKISLEHKEQLQEEVKEIIASAAEIVQKVEEKEDSGKKDSEDITKEPSSLSPDKLDSSEKKTTDTDMKPDVDQKEQVLEKMEESQERISTIESGATTTAPTLPEDERIPLDEIKEDIDEKHVIEEVKEKDSPAKPEEEEIPETVPVPAKPEVKVFDVRQAMQSLQRDIVKTPDEVADLPVHEEVDPKLYRMEDFEKGKEEKPSPTPQEVKEPPTPPVKEQKGVFSFFGKVADKFEKGIDKLTKKSKKDGEKDSDDKSSKSSSPKEVKLLEKTVLEEVDMEKMFPKVGKSDKPDAFEEAKPTIADVKVAAIKETSAFIQGEIVDAQRQSVPDIEEKLSPGKLEEIKQVEAEIKEATDKSPPKSIEDKEIAKKKLLDEEDIGEEAEEVKALLEEASKKFKTVKDSLRDSLESLEEKIKEEEIAKILQEVPSSSKDAIKDTLEGVVEKLEVIKPHLSPDIVKEPEKVKFAIPKDEEFEEEYEEQLEGPYRDMKEGIRDVGEVLAGTAGIILDDKPKDVVEIVKKVAEVLREDDFLSGETLFGQEGEISSAERKPSIPSEKVSPEKATASDEKESKLSEEDVVVPTKVGITEEFPVQEEVEDLIEKLDRPSTLYQKPGAVEIKEEPCIKVVKDKTDATSPKKDAARDMIDAQKICSEMLKDDQHICDQHKKPTDIDISQVDVMQAGIESVCVKQVAKRPSLEEIEQPVISFEQKVSPAKAEIVMVTPGSTPTSPKFASDKLYDEELEISLQNAPKLPEDVEQVLSKEAPVEEIIEELIITKKKKITIEIIEYITVVKRIPRERVIYIIEEIIVKKNLSREDVVDDPEVLKVKESITPEKRMEVEEYIVNEYIVKGKRITIEVVDEISIKKVVPKKIVVEIIEEIIVKKKIARNMVLDVPENVLSEIIKEESPEESPEESVEEQITPRIDITTKRESTTEIPSAPIEVEESIAPQQQTEIENLIVNEYIIKGRKLTTSAIDEISTTKTVPKQILIEIIEEIIIRKKIPRNAVLDIAEDETLTTAEVEEQKEAPKAEDEKRKSVTEVPSAEIPETEEPVTPQKRAEVEEYIVNEYITKGDSINIQKLEEICNKKKVPKRIIIEIIEEIIVKRKIPRSKVLSVPEAELSRIIKEEETLEPEISTEKRKSVAQISSPDKEKDKGAAEEEDVEEEVDGFVSIPRRISDEKVDAQKKADVSPTAAKEHEKDVNDDFEAVEQEYKVRDIPVTSPEKADEMREKEEAEEGADDTTSDVIEADEKFVQETKEKIGKEEPPVAKDIKTIDEKREPEEPETSEVSEIVDTIEKYLDEAKEKTDDTLPKDTIVKSVSPDEVKKIEPVIKEKIDEPQLTKEDKSKSTTPIKDETLEGAEISTEEVPEKVATEVKPETKLADATGFASPQEIPDEALRKKRSISKEPEDEISKAKDESLVDVAEPSEKIADEELSTDKPLKVDDVGTVKRMLVTASSEDGREETEICPTGSITFMKIVTPDDSLKDVSVKTTPDKDSLLDKESLRSGASTPEKDSISEKSVPEGKDKTTPEDSLEKSPLGTRDSQDLEDSLEKSEPRKPKEKMDDIAKPKSPAEKEDLEISDKIATETDKSKSPEKQEEPIAEPLKSDEKDTAVESIEKPKLPIEKALPESEHEKAAAVPKTPESLRSEDVSPAETIFSKSPTDKPEMYFAKAPISEEDVEEVSGKSPEQVADKKLPAPTEREEILDAAPTEKSRSPSISGEKPEERDASGTPSEKSEEKEPSVRSKSPSIAGELAEDKVRSPSIASVKAEELKLTEPEGKIEGEKSRSSSITMEKLPEDIVSDKRHSIIGEEIIEPVEKKSRSPSIASDKGEKEDKIDKSRSPSIISEPIDKEILERRKSSVAVVDEIDEGKAAEKSRSPSIADKISDDKIKLGDEAAAELEKPEEKEESADKSKSPSIASEKSEQDIKSLDKSSVLSDKAESGETDKPKSPSAVEKEAISEKSPIVESEHDDEKGPIDETRSPSAISDKSDERKEADRSKSPSTAADKPDLQDVTERYLEKPKSPIFDRPESPKAIDKTEEPQDKDRSPSVASDKSDSKKVSDRSRSPSISIEKVDSKVVDLSIERSRSPSVASVKDDKLEQVSRSPSDIPDKSKSPSPVEQKVDIGEKEKSRSPSIAGEPHVSEERKKSPSPVGEKADSLTQVSPIDKSRSSSITSVTDIQKESADRSKSPSIADEKPEASIEKSRSPSVASTEQKESADRSKPSSIIGEKPDIKDVLEPPVDRSRSSSVASTAEEKKESADRSKSPSITDEKPEASIEKSRSPSAASTEQKESADRSKPSSIIGEKPDIKDVLEPPVDRSRSSSVASAAEEKKEPSDRSKSPSVAGEKPDLKDVAERPDEKSRSPSVMSVASDLKEPADRSKSPSVAGEKPDLKDVAERPDEKSRSPSVISIASDLKEPADRSKSPSIAGEKPDEKDALEPTTDKSRSASVASITGEQKETDRSKSPSVAGEKPDLKDVTEQQTEKSPSTLSVAGEQEKLADEQKSASTDIKQEPIGRSKSPSIASEKSDGKKSAGDSKSSSIAGEKADLADVAEQPTDKSKPSTVSDKKEELERSKSPSATSDKSEEAKSAISSKPSSVAGDTADLKDVLEPPGDKSRSASVTSATTDQKEPIEKATSPTISQERSKSPSVASEKSDDKKSVDSSRATSVTEEKADLKDVIELPADKSRSSSVASEKAEAIGKSISPTALDKLEPPVDQSKSSAVPDKLDIKPDDVISHDKSRSPSIVLDKPMDDDRQPTEEIDIDGLKTFDATGESGLPDKTRSLSIISDKTEPKSPSDASKSPSSVDDQKDKSRSSSVASEKLDDVDTKISPSEAKERSISPSLDVGKTSKDGSAKSSRASSPEDKLAADRSRSQSVFDTGEKTPASGSRTASLFDEKPPEQIVPQEKDEHKDLPRKKSSVTSPEAIQREMQKIREKRFADFEEPDAVEPSKIEKSDDEEEGVVKVTAEKRAEIEKYILEEYIVRKRKISLVVIEKLVMMYSVPQFIVMEIIEDIISRQNIPRNTVLDFLDDLKEKSPDVAEAKEKSVVPTGVDLGGIAFAQEHLQGHAKPSGVRGESPDGKVSPAGSDRHDRDGRALSASPSPEPIPSDKSTQDSPARSEPHIDEEILISEEKRVETEKLLEEEYIKKGRKITEVILEEIIIRTSLPRYIILEIVEEIILKRKIPRESVIDLEIYQEEEPEEDYDKAMYRFDRVADGGTADYEMTRGARKPSVEYGMEYSPSGERQEDKSADYPIGYESQFHKAFVGGMTEMRTTHITTLSGKSTPEFTSPESGVESADKASGKLPEHPLTTTHITKTDPHDLKTIQPMQTVTILRESKIGEPADEPEETAEEGEQSTDDIIVVKKIVKREVEEEEPEKVAKESVIEDVSESKHETAEPQEQPEVLAKEIKRPSVQQDEPEAITKIIKREIVEHDEPEVITKVVKREIIEQDEPEIITKVIRREIVVPDEEVDDSNEDTGEYVKTITTKTTRTIVTEELPDAELSQTDPSKIYTDPTSGTTYRVVSDDGASDATASADVKRIVTTVTTITGPDGKITTKKDVTESTDTVDSEELLEKLIDSGKITAETTKSAEKIIKETITTVTSGTSTPDVKAFYDSGKSTPDLKHEEKVEPAGKERLSAEKLEHSVSPLVRDLMSDDKSYSGKSSPDISLPKDIVFSGSTGKSTPEVPMSPLIRDGAAIQHHLSSGRSTPDRRSDGRSSTGTPEGFRSGEMIRTTITTTKTISDEGEIVTTTKEVTETTNEKGETVVLAEKTDVKVDERGPGKDSAESAISSIISSIKSSEQQRGGSAGSDDEPPGSPLSSTSQAGYEKEEERQVEFSAAAMSGSFYGELPAVPPQISAMKTFHGETGMQKSGGDPAHSRFMVEKEFAGGYGEKPDAKKYVDEADLDFDKALMEHKEMKEASGAFSGGITPRYTNGSLRHETGATQERPSSSFRDDAKDDSKSDSKKDPLEGWGSPLGLPSPKPPRKFNLKSPVQPQPSCSSETTADTLNFDLVKDWGEPLRLPSPAPVTNEVSNKGAPSTPKKERKQAKKIQSENIKNKKRSESPGKNEKKMKDSKNKIQPVYMDLAYVPHHGNSYYTSLEFFKRVRARYYVFSGTEPSREVYDALLEAKKTWEDKELEVTMIPTYDTDTLGYWVADNEEALAANHIDLSPSASRCTINLQDHETSCSAYRLEF
nr:PREDICTED: LOW QUALITY PROTEIN: microtubule-associated protein futsch-like [Linepithema humile]